MIVPQFEISLPPRGYHGGGSDSATVGLCVVSLDGAWQGHTLERGADGMPILRPIDHERLCAMLHEIIDRLD